jgi:DNA-binding CsgD family transcriptional regulator
MPIIKKGWPAHYDMLRRIMENDPEPNARAGAQVRRENMAIRVMGDMSWVTFDQITPDTDDPLVTQGLSREMRVLERHDGKWLHVFLSNIQSALPTYTSPTIAVDARGDILWMNRAAREGLVGHPVLKSVGGRLVTYSRQFDADFHTLLARVSEQTMVDLTWASRTGAQGGGGDTFLIEDPSGERIHILWVRQSEALVLVSFGDAEALAQRLETASRIFQLSKAQARLALLIAGGLSLPDAAEAMKISVNTARTHLNRAYEKTRVNSQPSLVRVLMRAAQPIEK